MESNSDVTSDKPKIVVLCGSSRFVDVMAVCAWLIERDEQAIALGLHLLPVWYPDCPKDHLAEHEGVAERMDELHLRKIDLADEIFIVNLQNYIGESTTREIAYAMSLKKTIRWRAMSADMNTCPGRDLIHSYMPDAMPSLEDRQKARAFLAVQCREVLAGRVTCECGRNVSIRFAYRCFYCGMWFCHACARKHFSVPDEWQGWYDFEVKNDKAGI